MSVLVLAKDTTIEGLTETEFHLRKGQTQELSFRLPASRKPWVDFIRENEPTLEKSLEFLLGYEKKLPLQEALSFLQMLSQTGHLSGLEKWQSEIKGEEALSQLLLETDPKKVAAELRKINFFEKFSDAALTMLSKKAMLHQVAPGTYIVHQGDEARDFFVLLRGSVSVYVKKPNGVRTRVCVLREGTVFGEGSFKGVGLRQADVFAKDEVQLLSISADLFDECLSMHTDESLNTFLRERIMLSQFLSTSPIFKALPVEALGLFIQEGEMFSLAKDKEIFRQGEIGDAFYLLVRGQVSVHRNNEAPVLLSQGDCFGEIALFKGVPRTATLKCMEESFLLKISAKGFWKIIFGNLGMALMLEEVAENRLKGDPLTLT